MDNTPPELYVVSPFEDQEVFMKEEWVNLQVDAQDNIAMDRVEFYMIPGERPADQPAETITPEGQPEGELLGYTTIAPYTARMMLKDRGTGTYRFYAIAYDAAGNQVRSETVQVKVRPNPPE